MNKKIPLAVLVGVVVVAAAAAFGYSAGVAAVKEQFGVKGWVQVKVVRDGQVIYYHEGHNLITNYGKDFIAQQLGSTSPASNGANYIGLSNSTDTPQVNWLSIPGEFQGYGLQRSQGGYSHTSGSNSFTVTKEFTAEAIFGQVKLAGLYSTENGNTLVAANTFSPVNLISGDKLTITWTITFQQQQ
ncbi:MAG: hypothetical protein QW158_08465 [Nitrososphaerales archaeon]